VDPPPARQRARVLSAATAPDPRRPLPLLARWWFWALVVGAAFSIPLIKALTSKLPPMLPGLERQPSEAVLPDERGEPVTLASLRGRLVVLMPLSLANETEREVAMRDILALRKHLRGLDQALDVLVLCRGGGAADLSPLLDLHKARKPTNLFVIDEDGAVWERLCKEAAAPSAAALLLDRHGRVRGTYGESEAERARLIAETGQIANWVGEDPD
jgi:hypothetical protein